MREGGRKTGVVSGTDSQVAGGGSTGRVSQVEGGKESDRQSEREGHGQTGGVGGRGGAAAKDAHMVSHPQAVPLST